MSAAQLYHLEREQFIPQPLDKVFALFADAANLEALTPGFLHFQFLTALPIRMEPGALIDYRIRIFGVPVRWRTRIETFEPLQRFTDIQLRGPYRSWHHTHEFREVPGGTMIRDVVDYSLPLGILGAAANAVFVRGRLKSIFDYRSQRVNELLAAAEQSGTSSSPGPNKSTMCV